jgi:hypothetical protein
LDRIADAACGDLRDILFFAHKAPAKTAEKTQAAFGNSKAR